MRYGIAKGKWVINKSLAGHDDLTDVCKTILIHTHRAVATAS